MGDKKKILIADDEKRITELVSDYLEGQDYVPVCCYDGTEAVEAVKNDPEIALVILDIMMPKKSGLEGLKH